MKPIRILLVEDTPLDARLIRSILRPPSFEVMHVDRLSDALSMLRSAPIDVVLLDLNLPDSRGSETLDSVLEQAPDIAIVVITGDGDEHAALAAVALGAQDYLIKGETDADLLTRAIRYAVERAQILSTLEEERRFQRALLDLWTSKTGRPVRSLSASKKL